LAWNLSGGALHVTDRSNAGVNGLVALGVEEWDQHALSVLGLDAVMMPSIVDTMGSSARHVAARCTDDHRIGRRPVGVALWPVVHLSGAKITFGTGAMLDMVRGMTGRTDDTICVRLFSRRPAQSRSRTHLGIEAIVLSRVRALNGSATISSDN